MGILKRFFGKQESQPSTPDPKKPLDPFQIIGDFGATIQERAQRSSYVIDESKLPYPKNKIKEAIIVALETNVAPQLMEHLKTAYIELCWWQKGVGPEDKLWGPDLLSIDRNQDPVELARQISEQDIDPSWSEKIEAERESLVAELQRCGLWDTKP